MVMYKIKNFIKSFVPERYHKFVRRWKNLIYPVYVTRSYSMEGEDIILRRYFEGTSKGFYIDVGAHHPVRFSNTYVFYKMGWCGINIDARPGSMALFNRFRRRDLNLEVAIANDEKDMTYYILDEPALNSFSKDRVEMALEDEKYDLVNTIHMKSRRLSDVLDEYMPSDCKITFLNVDVEGLDLEVLMSNNWDKYRPIMVVVERLISSMDELYNDKLAQFMKENGYSLYAKTVNTIFYVESRKRG